MFIYIIFSKFAGMLILAAIFSSSVKEVMFYQAFVSMSVC